MKQIFFILLTATILLLRPLLSDAGETRVYVGFSVGTAIVVGSGIASFNIGVNQRVGEREPESGSTETDPPPALAEINRKAETVPPWSFLDSRIDSQPDPPQPLRFEFPFFILRW